MAALDEADAVFAEVAARGPALANCHARITALAARWRRFAAGDDDERVHWVEIGPRSASFFDTPLSVAREFSACRATSDAAWIMTSATLAVAGSFSHFTTALGLSGAVERLWASPFDYASQALLYLPPLACEPRATGFEEALVAAALPVLEASRGRAFMLFTSFRALYRCADLLRAQSSFPLLVQGEAPRSELLRRFHTIDRAVLLGTATFWEGIDVRGERLSCVIIDKLPFAVPDDPVLRARSAALAARGDDAFELLQLPEAITALKQGAGRLIRAVDDRGVLMIADVRLRRRQYGSTFLASLPPMPVTEDLADIRRFYADGACAPLYSTPDVDRA
jgi:ATP-dependent DNA helicase DinG